ncbi:hypothetical protein [Wukongibacter sp. M2B1]|uniref:hypothetical protein n=1 Tax=Wukongibacter sp. M2B1 TaxID=3088895 RepID=UPI003D78E845
MTKNNWLNSELVFLTLSLSLAVIGFLVRKQYNYVYNSVIIYIGYLLLIHLEYRKNFKVKKCIRILIVITVLLHNILGQYFNFYRTVKWFDKVLHLFGTFSFTLFFYSIIESTIKISHGSKVYTFINIASIGIAIGVFLENIEFILDVIIRTNNQHGANDINLDLIFNVIGAAIAGLLWTINKNH